MKKTDWDSYYQKPYKTASFTRRITQNALIKYMEQYATKSKKSEICEMGGANSCFYDCLIEKFKPKKYTIIDNNKLGLEKFSNRHSDNSVANLVVDNVLDLNHEDEFDIVYSVGLIEHFEDEGVVLAVKSHFDLLKKDGIVIISVPTPTFLYKITRKISEILNLWIFHDEKPITVKDAKDIINQFGRIMNYKILWGVVLTQVMFVIKKK